MINYESVADWYFCPKSGIMNYFFPVIMFVNMTWIPHTYPCKQFTTALLINLKTRVSTKLMFNSSTFSQPTTYLRNFLEQLWMRSCSNYGYDTDFFNLNLNWDHLINNWNSEHDGQMFRSNWRLFRGAY